MQYGYFNTASGIIQKQSFLMVATIAFIALFQYRKRYGPVATGDLTCVKCSSDFSSFNTASGMALLQQLARSLGSVKHWSFNTASGMALLQPIAALLISSPRLCFNTASGITQLQRKYGTDCAAEYSE